jgi:hypothetical protein
MYAEGLVESADIYGLDVFFHFHIIDDDSKSLSLSIKKDNVSYTYSNCAYTDKKQYYAIARYLVLPQLMSLYSSDTCFFVIDVDVIFSGEMNAFIDNAKNSSASIGAVSNYFFDIENGLYNKGANSVYKRNMPWKSVKAGILFLKNTDEGRKFSKSLSSVLFQHFIYRKGIVSWWLDQSVLFTIFSSYSALGFHAKDFFFIKSLYPLDLHTAGKCKKLGNPNMSKEEYLKVKLDLLREEISNPAAG